MARYIDGHAPTRSNPDTRDVIATAAIVGVVVIGGMILLKRVGESGLGEQITRAFVRGLPIPEGLKPTEYPFVPDSLYMDATGHWCWLERKPDGTLVTKCVSRAGFDPGTTPTTGTTGTTGGGGSW